MSYRVVLDPPQAITGRTVLDLNRAGILSEHAGVDWGEAALKAFMAEQRYGESPTDYRVPNRTVTVPLGLGMDASETGEEEARRQLQEKVGLLQRQGGVLMRQRGSGSIANYVPNPSLERSIEGWVLNINFNQPSDTIERAVPPVLLEGGFALKVMTSGEFTKEGAEIEVQNSLDAIFFAGVTYTASIWVYGVAGGEKLKLLFGGGAGADKASTSFTTTKGVWQRWSVSWTPTETHGGPSGPGEPATMAVQTNEKAVRTFWLDAALVEEGAEATPYVDGDTPGYYWAGTPELAYTGEGGSPLYADIVNASLVVPDLFGETAGIEAGVSLKLECLPDFYGVEVALDPLEEAGQIVAILKQNGVPAIIGGDYPARTRIVLSERSSNAQRALLWGLRSTHLPKAEGSGAEEAPLFLDAHEAGALNGTATVADAGAFSGFAAQIAAPVVNIWHPILSTDKSTFPLEHVGTYRVFARVKGEASALLRLAWSNATATAPTINAAASYAGGSARMVLDLGEVALTRPPVGGHWWRGIFQLETGSTSHTFAIDRIWFQPIDDGAGKLRATAVPAATLLSPSAEPETVESSAALHAGKVWTNPTRAARGHVGEWAEVFAVPGETSQALAGKGFGFGLPEGATVKGIELAVHGSSPANVTAQLLKAGAAAGTTHNWLAQNGGPLRFGGPGDLWETTWTPAQINAGNFGAFLYVVPSFFNQKGIVRVEAIVLTVFWSFASTVIAQDAVLNVEKNAEIRYDGSYRQDPTTSSAYARVSSETGDLVRLPPSGLEQREVELFLKNSRGNLAEGDPAIDKLEAQVLFRPCYIGRI